MEPIRADHHEVLERLRYMYVQSGGKMLDNPDVWGLNENEKISTLRDGDFALVMDGGHPYQLVTNIGYYMVIGGLIGGDGYQFMRLLYREFTIRVLHLRHCINDGDDRHPTLRWPGPTLIITTRDNNGARRKEHLRPYDEIITELPDKGKGTPYDALGNARKTT